MRLKAFAILGFAILIAIVAFRDGNDIATSQVAWYIDIGLSEHTTYTYTVSARDVAGNESAQSTPIQVTTPALTDAPYPASTFITDVTFDFDTHYTTASGSDNWPLTWADDNHQYTSFGDGGGFGGTNSDGRVSLGFARIEGDYPAFEGLNVWGGANAENPATFEGKSIGIISIDGTLYAWRNGNGSTKGAYKYSRLYRSTNKGATWEEAGVEFDQDSDPGSLGFFSPTFLQFGKDYAGARDSFVYIYAPEIKQTSSWDVHKPGEIALVRVPLSQITNQGAYEFFGGLDNSKVPMWTSDISARKPVFEDTVNGVMRTQVTYNSGLQRYLLTTQHTSRTSAHGGGNIGMYEAPEPWGPWNTIMFEHEWAPELSSGRGAYMWTFSNKWTSADGLDFVLVFPANDEWNSLQGTFTVYDDTPFYCSIVSEIPNVECEALLALFIATDGPSWTSNSGWLETDTPCSWFGVICSTGHVVRILLGNNQLSGSIPEELGNLSNLDFLDLSGNQLRGSLTLNLKNLNLAVFHFDDTALCEPPDAGFQEWLATIDELQSTGVVCITTPCTLTLDLGYSDGTLTMDFELGTQEPALWGAWIFIPGSGFFTLWAMPLAPFGPPASFQIPAPGFPSFGTIGVLTALTTSEGITCSGWATVDTGAPSIAVPSAGELRELLPRPNGVFQGN